MNRVHVYYRAHTAKDNVYSFYLPRKCFDENFTRVYLSNYRLRKCECDVCLVYGDCLDFSLDVSFRHEDCLDVYRTSGRLYRACRG